MFFSDIIPKIHLLIFYIQWTFRLLVICIEILWAAEVVDVFYYFHVRIPSNQVSFIFIWINELLYMHMFTFIFTVFRLNTACFYSIGYYNSKHDSKKFKLFTKEFMYQLGCIRSHLVLYIFHSGFVNKVLPTLDDKVISKLFWKVKIISLVLFLIHKYVLWGSRLPNGRKDVGSIPCFATHLLNHVGIHYAFWAVRFSFEMQNLIL